jgi:hypothetical protein
MAKGGRGMKQLWLAFSLCACASAPNAAPDAKDAADAAEPAEFECPWAASCDDKNPCTDEWCGDDHSCSHRPRLDGATCAENCNVGSCSAGVCVKKSVLDCADADDCTADSCGPYGSCVHTLTVSGPAANCKDGIACTEDGCVFGLGCQHLAISAACEDGDPCTVDTCITGCKHVAIWCIDGNACTADACSQGACTFLPVNCDDGDPCTVDTCDPTLGCAHSKGCEDANACTLDSCVNAACVHDPTNCNDGDPCTNDACDAAIGCVHAAKCDDGKPCTEDVCSQGICSNTNCPNGVCPSDPAPCLDSNPCTADACDPTTQQCLHSPKSCEWVSGFNPNPPMSTVCTTAADCPCDWCTDWNSFGEMAVCDDVHRCHVKEHCLHDQEYVGYGCVPYNSYTCSGSYTDPGSLQCFLSMCVGPDPQTWLYKCGGCKGASPYAKGYCPYCVNDTCYPVEPGAPCKKDQDCPESDYCTPYGCKPDTCNGGACVQAPWPEAGQCYACAANGSALIGKPIDCSDGDPCTEETWSPTAGCGHKPAPKGAECSPNWAAVCLGGVCVKP